VDVEYTTSLDLRAGGGTKPVQRLAPPFRYPQGAKTTEAPEPSIEMTL
jgi:hypothetical protein